jgi:gluconate 2-dehydrogenase gamma chain
MSSDLSRRHFLLQAGSGISAAWLSVHWPALLSAATHAHRAARSAMPSKFEFFSPEQAVEIDAITARIIPSDDMPGAREAGAAYFIDRALVTFAIDSQGTYKNGLADLQARVRELFPTVTKFSAAAPDQQDEVLRSFSAPQKAGRRGRFRSGGDQSFFETVRAHTIVAFLIDPESGGNRDGVGWKVIGRAQEHVFQPPFGYYDKDYAGWQPNPQKTDPNKA